MPTTINASEEPTRASTLPALAKAIEAFFRSLVSSPSPEYKLARLALISVAILGAGKHLQLAILPLFTDAAYIRDFVQEYSMARAYFLGVSPYLPISELVTLIGGPAGHLMNHPTPHPPTAAILVLPLAVLPYKAAAALWFFLQLGCLVFIAKRLRGPTTLILIAMLASRPVSAELKMGQLQLPIAVLLIVCLQLLREDRQAAAGIMLGLCLGLKLWGVPLLVYCLFKRMWRCLGYSTAVFVSLHFVFAALFGMPDLLSYYRTIVPTVTDIYLVSPANRSLWTLGWRLFSGMEPIWFVQYGIRPLVSAPHLSYPFSLFVVAAVTLFYFRRLLRLANRNHGLYCCIAVSLLLTPITWDFAAVVLLSILADVRREDLSLSSGERLAAIALLTGLFFGDYLDFGPLLGNARYLPFALGCLGLVPTAIYAAFAYHVLLIAESRERIGRGDS